MSRAAIWRSRATNTEGVQQRQQFVDLSADCDLMAVKEGLRAQGQGRLCFFGPPGTGKTAFGRHLAEVMDRPLLVKRASDLQSMWVGETEKNMARMFEEARSENAVLLLDEADSFLQDRKGAQGTGAQGEACGMVVGSLLTFHRLDPNLVVPPDATIAVE